MNNSKSDYNIKKSEISLPEIFRVIFRRKWIVVISIIIAIILAIAYNFIKKPIYQSSVLIKKEMFAKNENQQDRIQNLLALRSLDELETEMQLVQTRKVINSVIDELSLNIKINKVVEKSGNEIAIDKPITEYQNNYNLGLYSESLPKINKFNFGIITKKSKFTIQRTDNNSFVIYDDSGKDIFKSGESYSNLKPSDWVINFNWNANSNINELQIETIDYNDLHKDLTESIYTSKIVKTNIFEIAAQSNYSYTTMLIANTLANKFKASRINQQKANIKYSFDFIDDNLNEVANKLEVAESNLSNFKTKESIVQIDEQSKKLVEFLSNLEGEKLKNDLQLGIYLNKINNFEKQVIRDGYIDQTYLTPEQYQNTDSPFANMLNQLSRLELQKLELLQKRTEFHPDVILLNEQIENIKLELTKYNRNTLTSFKILANTLKNKQHSINTLINKYSSKLKKLPKQESQLASLIRNKAAYEKMYTLLLDKREEMRVIELSRMQDIIILDPAIEQIKPISPNKKLNLLFASLFGLFIGLIAVFVNNFMDDKVSDIYEIERDYDFPILSVIPPFEKQSFVDDKISNNFITMMDDNFKYKEAYRTIDTKLSSRIKNTPKKIMITSCEESAGKTTAASNLAITVAQSGKKVLLIDCDIKKPSIAELFGLPKYSSGLIDYLTEKTDSPNIYKPVRLTNNSNLLLNIDIIPTGVFSNISGEILASDRMKNLLTNLEGYDFVIFDTPPLTRLSDAISLGRLIKDTVLVIRAGQTIKESISWAIAELQTSEINFQGVIVNDCSIKGKSYKYQYGYEKV